ncbi:MAG: TIGR00282 family metallophosphoesterase [Spirochaetales bacterium]|nr:TIGR00282 family metallophosphoesterase [Spirochaetales bacterium]
MNEIRVLILGDVVGQPGCRALFFSLDRLKKEYRPDHVIVNGENAADGFGILPEQVDQFFSRGIDIISSGNHIWQKREILPYLDSQDRLLRPVNYPSETPGHGWCLAGEGDKRIAMVNIQGRTRMGSSLDSPFKVMKKILPAIKKDTNRIIVDFHAEDPAEKEALAAYLDGEVSAVVGTHTHVQTADERIWEKGTGYITDIGYIGVKNSVIGTDPDLSVRRAQTQMPLKSEIIEGDTVLHGVLLVLDGESGRTTGIERIRI